MRQYERNGVTIDQCTECRGIFLDRGELERLIDAEQAWERAPAAPAAPAAPRASRPYVDQPTSGYQGGYAQGGYEQRDPRQGSREYGSTGHGKPRRKKSFIEELFD